ncbi:unnamed protein product [Protopolystoma xenopodis]|uniref:LIM zinc-binding domain-containing protein n=1 Tax=Protopolystoma xenopodis TaxID=117903 RepID=A0A3S5AT99_9PLAT|nr:unnamed protein product [Protopolystoma xenopodis]
MPRYLTHCQRCGAHLSSDAWVHRVNRLPFHLTCFTCFECGRQMGQGDRCHLVLGGRRLVCSQHRLVAESFAPNSATSDRRTKAMTITRNPSMPAYSQDLGWPLASRHRLPGSFNSGPKNPAEQSLHFDESWQQKNKWLIQAFGGGRKAPNRDGAGEDSEWACEIMPTSGNIINSSLPLYLQAY